MEIVNIKVKTRKEFIEQYRKIFIPNSSEFEQWNHGYNLNNWTMFFTFNEDKSKHITVELEE